MPTIFTCLQECICLCLANLIILSSIPNFLITDLSNLSFSGNFHLTAFPSLNFSKTFRNWMVNHLNPCQEWNAEDSRNHHGLICVSSSRPTGKWINHNCQNYILWQFVELQTFPHSHSHSIWAEWKFIVSTFFYMFRSMKKKADWSLKYHSSFM